MPGTAGDVIVIEAIALSASVADTSAVAAVPVGVASAAGHVAMGSAAPPPVKV
jgi:hypothetical protein